MLFFSSASSFFLEMFRFFFFLFNILFPFYIRNLCIDLTFEIAQIRSFYLKKKKSFKCRSISTWMNFFFSFGWWTHSLSFVFRVADSCTDASFALGQLRKIAHTHTRISNHSKIICGIHKKNGYQYKFSTVISDYISSENAMLFFFHCKVTFKPTLVESLVACSIISIWCQKYEKRISFYLKY